jgi:hypothetical protein
MRNEEQEHPLRLHHSNSWQRLSLEHSSQRPGRKLGAFVLYWQSRRRLKNSPRGVLLFPKSDVCDAIKCPIAMSDSYPQPQNPSEFSSVNQHRKHHNTKILRGPRCTDRPPTTWHCQISVFILKSPDKREEKIKKRGRGGEKEKRLYV